MTRRVPVALLALALLSPAPGAAATRRVPLDHATIAAALAAAAPGDTIAIAAGTFSTSGTGETFPVDVTKAGITLRGAGMGLTVLDAEGQGSVVRLRAPGARVEDCTLTGGVAVRGGGVFIGVGATGTPVVARCLLLGNAASDRGSGIFADQETTPWIHHNVVWQSHDADVAAAGDPHGIQLYGAHGVVEHNLIGRGDSNGLLNEGPASTPIVRNNIFYRNGSAALNRGRGFCALGNLATEIRNNLFFENVIAALIMRVDGVALDVSGSVANGLIADDAVDGNRDGDPAFVDEVLHDWRLTPGSAALDAGWPGTPADPDGTPADIGPFFLDQATTGVEPLPGAIVALRAVPNPVGAGRGTTFRVRLAQAAADVAIAVHDARGRVVARLVAGGPRPAGTFDVRWDAAGVPAGVYFARARVDGVAAGARLVVVD